MQDRLPACQTPPLSYSLGDHTSLLICPGLPGEETPFSVRDHHRLPKVEVSGLCIKLPALPFSWYPPILFPVLCTHGHLILGPIYGRESVLCLDYTCCQKSTPQLSQSLPTQPQAMRVTRSPATTSSRDLVLNSRSHQPEEAKLNPRNHTPYQWRKM